MDTLARTLGGLTEVAARDHDAAVITGVLPVYAAFIVAGFGAYTFVSSASS